MEELAGVVLRISIIYLYALAALRLSGKRSIGDLSPMDFVVALILGDLFDDVIWAEIPVPQGLVAMTTIISLHMLMSYVTYKSTRLHNLVVSTPTPVVRKGRMVKEGLRRERTPKEEVLCQLHIQGEERIGDVHAAAWEPNGEMSVTLEDEHKPVEKRDLDRLQELFR